MLGRKQRISNQDWLDAIRGIERSCSRSHINELTARTVAEIRQRCLGKKTAYAWSGGKDSIVLGDLCEKAGVNQSVLVVCDLEYPAFLQWVSENKPKGLEIVNTGQDLEWLSKHPEMLFPKKSDVAAKWFHIVQHRGQAIYYKKHALDMIILGRRKADGNFVGRGSNIYTNAQGVTRYSPISGWTHEEVLAYIHYNKLPIPPSTIGRTAICAVLINGRQGSGRERLITAGEMSMTSTAPLWKKPHRSYHPHAVSYQDYYKHQNPNNYGS